MAPRVVVVGAGVLGASIAMRLAERGAQVAVLDADRPAAGASLTSFAWLNAAHKRPRSYFDLNVRGMLEHAALAMEFGATPWLHRGGRLEWFAADQAAAADRAFARLLDWGYVGGWIERRRAFALEPDLSQTATAELRPAYFPHEGWIDTATYVGAMLRRARSLGAEVSSGVRVLELQHRGGRVSGVRTSQGEAEADAVVNCAGADVNTIDGAPRATPMATTVGVLGYTPPLAAGFDRMVVCSGFALRPDGGGRIAIHHGAADAAAAAGASIDDSAAAMAALLQHLAPCVGPFSMESIRTTRRPVPADGLPVLGCWPELAGYYLAVTHSAVTLAPWLGRAVAEEVLRGPVRELEPYRPRATTFDA